MLPVVSTRTATPMPSARVAPAVGKILERMGLTDAGDTTDVGVGAGGASYVADLVIK